METAEWTKFTEESISYFLFHDLDQSQYVAVAEIEVADYVVDVGGLRDDDSVAPEPLDHLGNRTDTQSTVLNAHWPHSRAR